MIYKRPKRATTPRQGEGKVQMNKFRSCLIAVMIVTLMLALSCAHAQGEPPVPTDGAATGITNGTVVVTPSLAVPTTDPIHAVANAVAEELAAANAKLEVAKQQMGDLRKENVRLAARPTIIKQSQIIRQYQAVKASAATAVDTSANWLAGLRKHLDDIWVQIGSLWAGWKDHEDRLNKLEQWKKDTEAAAKAAPAPTPQPTPAPAAPGTAPVPQQPAPQAPAVGAAPTTPVAPPAVGVAPAPMPAMPPAQGSIPAPMPNVPAAPGTAQAPGVAPAAPANLAPAAPGAATMQPGTAPVAPAAEAVPAVTVSQMPDMSEYVTNTQLDDKLKLRDDKLDERLTKMVTATENNGKSIDTLFSWASGVTAALWIIGIVLLIAIVVFWRRIGAVASRITRHIANGRHNVCPMCNNAGCPCCDDEAFADAVQRASAPATPPASGEPELAPEPAAPAPAPIAPEPAAPATPPADPPAPPAEDAE